MSRVVLMTRPVSGDPAQQLKKELTTLWTLLCAFFVFLMQSGFAMLEAGTVRRKNVKNILLKNTVDAAISTLCYWAVGGAFAYGTSCDGSTFIGAYRGLVCISL